MVSNSHIRQLYTKHELSFSPIKTQIQKNSKTKRFYFSKNGKINKVYFRNREMASEHRQLMICFDVLKELGVDHINTQINVSPDTCPIIFISNVLHISSH